MGPEFFVKRIVIECKLLVLHDWRSKPMTQSYLLWNIYYLKWMKFILMKHINRNPIGKICLRRLNNKSHNFYNSLNISHSFKVVEYFIQLPSSLLCNNNKVTCSGSELIQHLIDWDLFLEIKNKKHSSGILSRW